MHNSKRNQCKSGKMKIENKDTVEKLVVEKETLEDELNINQAQLATISSTISLIMNSISRKRYISSKKGCKISNRND